MGGSISAGADNDEMIDNLIKSRYIRTNVVERVFRSVDRAFYFLDDFQHTAYRDLAWKQGNLHLSAPCIYSEVLEHLKLEPGQSFLNIGSGTGYLSTLAGLILGPYGINHGVEVHVDVVEYAYEKLEQFKKTCNGVDVFEFCEPVFFVGNAFNLSQDRRYDRIYCGAACPEPHQEYIKKFMKVGGILVLPCEDDLLKIIRTSEGTWEISSVLPVSFSTMLFPDKNTSSSTISTPEPEPLRLQEICRSSIRSLLRSLVETEEPELTQKRKYRQKSSSRKLYAEDNRVVIPIFEDGTGIESAFTIQSSRFENFRPVAFERLIRNLTRNYQNLNDGDNVNTAYETASNLDRNSAIRDTRRYRRRVSNFEFRASEPEPEPGLETETENETLSNSSDADANAVDTNATSDFEYSQRCKSDSGSGDISDGNTDNRYRLDRDYDDGDDAGIADIADDGHSIGKTTNNSDENSDDVHCCEISGDAGDGSSDSSGVSSKGNLDNRDDNEQRGVGSKNGNDDDDDDDDDVGRCEKTSVAEINSEICMTDLDSVVSDVSNEKNGEPLPPPPVSVSPRLRQIAIKLRKGRFATKIKATKKHCSAVRNDGTTRGNSWKPTSDGRVESAGNCDRQPKKLMKREKLDSGISEESDDSKLTASNESSFAESANDDPMEMGSERDSDFTEDSSYEESSSSDVEPAETSDSSNSNSLSLKYRTCMEKKIQSLPLPKAVKVYLNYGRDFLASSQ